MQHTWFLTDEGGERFQVTLFCKYDDVIDAPLDPQYLIDIVGNATWEPSEVRKWVD